MLYLGLDVHSKWMTVRGMDPQTGESVEVERLLNDEESLREFFGGCAGPLHGVMESGTNSWAVYRILEPYFKELIVVDPATVWGKEGRRGAKTDRRDAMKLAVKMYRGELEPLYVPDVVTQDQRALGRGKINASRHVTKIVNEIGAQLKSWGIVVNCSLLSKEGRKLIEASKAKLPEYSLKVLELWLAMLKTAQEAEAELERAIKEEASRDEQCEQLMSIPGVGALTALVVKSEIGDIRRFGSATQLVCYSGLSPSLSQSADSVYHGKLNRFCNRFLKYVLVLRAQGMGRMKKDNPMRQTYWRVLLKHKTNPAKVVVARQLVRVIYAMLKRNERWDACKITQRRTSGAPAAA